ncbi:substrate-binding domain-containing protein [Streptomyces sp. NBC_00986]|uniref:substrate-binding domain-containing protein n=1 Tax=Streptomyces sp. NBC_00986 TaxID=2903702 RepID=UPI00386E8356|nr:substrate-binding domain-containing protein [Streptomyces sp. NBC_00986]
MSDFDPRGKTNRALLVGVSEYDITVPPDGVPGHLPAVKLNLNRLRDVLPRGRIFGDHEVRVLRSPTLGEFHRALRAATQEAEGLLLVYFAGHGAIPAAGDELFLQMRDATVVAGGPAVFPDAEMVTTMLTMLAVGPAERIVVILDCCFAGNAGWIWENFRDKRRVLLQMSVQANHRIDAGDGTRPTPFTERLVRLLDRDGEVRFVELSRRLGELMRQDGYETMRGDPWEPRGRWEPEEDVLLSARPVVPVVPVPPVVPVGDGATDTSDGTGPETVVSVFRRGWEALLDLLRTCGGVVAGWVGRLWALSRAATRITLVLALVALGLGSYGIYTLAASTPSCGPPLELRLLTDPDLEPTVRTAADAYLTSDANTTGDGCRRSGITVYSASSADVVTALQRQSDAWQEPHHEDTDPQRDIGPQPDIWIPASVADAARVTANQDVDSVVALTTDAKPLAYSPLVLAVPKNLAGEGSSGSGLRLNELITVLRGRAPDVEVSRPDPEFTDAALLATMGLYNRSEPRTAEGLVRSPGPPSPTAADLLCTLPDDSDADHRTAALVPEFLLKSGVGCDRATRVDRVAEYPDDAPGIEPAFVRVGWQGADRDQEARGAAVEDFHRWLAGSGGRAVFAADGFRSAGGDRPLLAPPSPGTGVDPTPADLSAGARKQQAMEDALKDYRSADGDGRVLFLIDDSGSMGALWDGPSGGRGLVKQSLGGLGGGDKYGVWGVSGLAPHDPPYKVLLAFGPNTRTAAESAIDKAKVQDAEADPHAALLAALDYLAEHSADDERPRLIVYVTDDEDNNRLTGANLDAVLKKAGLVKVPVAMVSLVSGGCDKGKPDERISDVSGGRCLDADTDLGASLHDEVARTGTGTE